MKCSRSNMILNISLNILFLFILRENVLVMCLISFLAPFFSGILGEVGIIFAFLFLTFPGVLWITTSVNWVDKWYRNQCKLVFQITNIKNNRNINFLCLKMVIPLSLTCQTGASNWYSQVMALIQWIFVVKVLLLHLDNINCFSRQQALSAWRSKEVFT